MRETINWSKRYAPRWFFPVVLVFIIVCYAIASVVYWKYCFREGKKKRKN